MDRRTQEPESVGRALPTNLLVSCLLSWYLVYLGRRAGHTEPCLPSLAQLRPWGPWFKLSPRGNKAHGVKTPGSPGQESEIRYSGLPLPWP